MKIKITKLPSNNKFSYGGSTNKLGGDFTNNVTFIDEGGTHEQNPFEGVPFGVDRNNTPNLVEEGEVIWNDYVFSNRLTPTKKMLENIGFPEKYKDCKKLPLSVAKKLSFADPYACAIFQLERMEDLGEAQNFRVEMAKNKCSEEEARKLAKENIFSKTVVFGLGMTGLFIADQIRKNHPDAEILFVGRSSEESKKVAFSKEIVNADYLCTAGLSEEETAKEIMKKISGRATMFVGTSGSNVEHRIAFQYKVLGCNGIYNSFSLGPKVQYDTMPFGFENHLIFASINFRQSHMEKAIEVLVDSRYDEVVELIDKEEFIKDPLDAYENKIFCKGAPLKTGVVWNKEYIDEDK